MRPREVETVQRLLETCPRTRRMVFPEPRLGHKELCSRLSLRCGQAARLDIEETETACLLLRHTPEAP